MSLKVPDFSLVDPSILDNIERQTDYILETIGLDVQGDPESLEALRSIGASVEGERVRLCGAAIREFIKDKIPRQFVWHGTDKTTSIICGDGTPIFATVYGAPKVSLLDGRIMPGNIAVYRDLVTLCDHSKSLRTTGFLVCYVHDLPEEIRHIKMAETHMTLSNKPFMGTIFSAKALLEVVDMVSKNPPKKGACNLLHLINSTPPLVYQKNPLECLRTSSLKGEGCIMTSYIMA